ncbi:hypothetical protein TNCV_4750441 [Trichonephila clavipes]|nr:hypothetical protein TNCV_4750441 [Trichonephila clavipes]
MVRHREKLGLDDSQGQVIVYVSDSGGGSNSQYTMTKIFSMFGISGSEPRNRHRNVGHPRVVKGKGRSRLCQKTTEARQWLN